MGTSLRILVFGAHPDDCEFGCGGSAALWSAAGHTVRFVSVTDGRCGHHLIEPDALVPVRIEEAARAAAVLGVESSVLAFRDGELEPNLETRREIIRIEREFRPHVILTHRPNDYHPDHRYTSQVVQDAAFLVAVPHVHPEFPALCNNPSIFYLSDRFREPHPLRPDAIVRIDAVMETKIDALACHRSQVFEWLPEIDGGREVPEGDSEKRIWLSEWVRRRDVDVRNRFRDEVLSIHGAGVGAMEPVEAFESCEYGDTLPPDIFLNLFGHPPRR